MRSIPDTPSSPSRSWSPIAVWFTSPFLLALYRVIRRRNATDIYHLSLIKRLCLQTRRTFWPPTSPSRILFAAFHFVTVIKYHNFVPPTSRRLFFSLSCHYSCIVNMTECHQRSYSSAFLRSFIPRHEYVACPFNPRLSLFQGFNWRLAAWILCLTAALRLHDLTLGFAVSRCASVSRSQQFSRQFTRTIYVRLKLPS